MGVDRALEASPIVAAKLDARLDAPPSQLDADAGPPGAPLASEEDEEDGASTMNMASRAAPEPSVFDRSI